MISIFLICYPTQGYKKSSEKKNTINCVLIKLRRRLFTNGPLFAVRTETLYIKFQGIHIFLPFSPTCIPSITTREFQRSAPSVTSDRNLSMRTLCQQGNSQSTTVWCSTFRAIVSKTCSTWKFAFYPAVCVTKTLRLLSHRVAGQIYNETKQNLQTRSTWNARIDLVPNQKHKSPSLEKR